MTAVEERALCLSVERFQRTPRVSHAPRTFMPWRVRSAVSQSSHCGSAASGRGKGSQISDFGYGRCGAGWLEDWLVVGRARLLARRVGRVRKTSWV